MLRGLVFDTTIWETARSCLTGELLAIAVSSMPMLLLLLVEQVGCTIDKPCSLCTWLESHHVCPMARGELMWGGARLGTSSRGAMGVQGGASMPFTSSWCLSCVMVSCLVGWVDCVDCVGVHGVGVHTAKPTERDNAWCS